MQENKIKANKKFESSEDNDEEMGDNNTSDSFMGSVTSSFSKKAGKKRNSFNSNTESVDLSTGFLNSLGFSKNEQKDLDQDEKRIYEYFRVRIRRWSYFLLFFASYALLGVCIGFSSAPFYESSANIKCYLFDLTPPCQALINKVNRLYLLEFFVGILIIT
jgi:hypothetical protein